MTLDESSPQPHAPWALGFLLDGERLIRCWTRPGFARAERGAEGGGMTMKRRTVLKVLSGAAVGVGVLGRDRLVAWAQAPPRSGGAPA